MKNGSRWSLSTAAQNMDLLEFLFFWLILTWHQKSDKTWDQVRQKTGININVVFHMISYSMLQNLKHWAF